MKYLLLLLLIVGTLLGSQNKYELKIYNTILHALFPNKQTVAIWSDNRQKLSYLSQLSFVTLTQQKNKADFLLITKDSNISANNALLFTTSYRLLQYYKDKAIGGFYWKKGRPNIIFIKHNIHKHNIHLPKPLHKYCEDDI